MPGYPSNLVYMPGYVTMVGICPGMSPWWVYARLTSILWENEARLTSILWENEARFNLSGQC